MRPWPRRLVATLKISLAPATALNAVFATTVTPVWWALDRGQEAAILLGPAALSAFNTLRFGHCMILEGIPDAKVLARAAQEPVPVPKRSVLLLGFDDGLVMVFFAVHAGPEDLPEAVMEVDPPGSSRHPRRGMPPTAGMAELHGWLDAGPTVAPWTGGCPVWPRHAYETVNLDDQRDRDYFAALAGAYVSRQ